MKCIICGAELTEGIKYCYVCGSPVSFVSNDMTGAKLSPAQQDEFYTQYTEISSFEMPYSEQMPYIMTTEKKSKKKSKKMTITLVSTIVALVIVVIVILVLSLNAGRNTKDTSAYDENSLFGSSESNRKNTLNDQIREEVKLAYDELIEKAMEYNKEGNWKGFSSLFTASTSSDHIERAYNMFSNNHDRWNYPDVQTEVVWDDETYYLCQNTRSKHVLKEDDKSSTYCGWCSMLITKEDDKWKFSIITDDDFGQKDIYPREFLDALDEGRNCVVIDEGDWSWVNCKIVFPEDFVTKVYLVYQNSDGSVDVLVNIKNGTDIERTITKLTITLEDEQLGLISDFTTTNTVSVGAQKAKNIWVHIDAEYVRTGKSTWEYVSVHSDFSYSP